ncbi:MAG: dockerin type I repeat-containing protein, partial [Prevotella sp.]|nr:dockerin type I repeat-containing protein [Prevotella sp.]
LDNTNECPIYVYEESFDDYLFDWKWSNYSDRIIPMRRDALLGDVNGDGSVNVTDVITVINFILDRDLGPFLHYLADMNNDGDVNISDVIAMVQELLKGQSR